MFEGVFSALITPFDESGENIDFDAWRSLIESQIKSGVHGLVVFGTTGESATLSLAEKMELAKSAVEISAGRVPVIAGSGSNSTKASVELTQSLKKLGVQGALTVVPYYNKPTQEGLYRHFSELADKGGLPVVLYNVPSRTNISISIETFKRLVVNPNIVAVKQASDSAGELIELAAVLQGTGTNLMAGDDPLLYFVMSLGGTGIVSASANVIPEKFVSIYNEMKAGNACKALETQIEILPVINSFFMETNPTPVKRALSMMGKIPFDSVRLPLVRANKSTEETLRKVLDL